MSKFSSWILEREQTQNTVWDSWGLLEKHLCCVCSRPQSSFSCYTPRLGNKPLTARLNFAYGLCGGNNLGYIKGMPYPGFYLPHCRSCPTLGITMQLHCALPVWQMASYEVLDSKFSVRAIITNHYKLSFPLCEQLFKILLDSKC